MAEHPKVIWTKKATADYISVLEYWTARNKSTAYAEKLITIVQHAVKQVQRFPKTGKPTSKKLYRYLIIDEDYLLIYKLGFETITIMRFWHGKQNPNRVAYLR